MVHFIYGPCGSGKTTVLYKYLESDLKQGKKAFLIVPEQETVAVERAISSIFPSSYQLDIEVLNFSRLCNRIFRIYGGLSYNTATKQIRSLIMWNTLRELSSLLEEYKSYQVNDFSLTQKMLSAYTELKAYCISPLALENACSKIGSDSSSYNKLRDISLVYSAYSANIEENFSDTTDDISKAIKILEAANPFKGANVYLDSFAGFTKQELEFISKISNLCDDIYITIPIKTPNDQSIHLEGLRQTVIKIKKYIGSSNFDEVFLDEIHSTHSPSLKHLQGNIWNFEAEPFVTDVNDIKIFTCDNPYSESNIVSSEISKQIQSGLRFNEIAIIVRDTEKYRGILDASLEKYRIPYFMSEKTDLMSKPLSKFLFSALKIKESNWRGSSVVAHLKSGYSDIDPFDIDIFEDYVNTWNINGNKFIEEKWTMNPDGYSAKITQRGQKILSVANQVREKTVSALSLYFARLDASENVKEMCSATLEFLKSSKITDKVRASCSENLAAGNKKAAEEDMKLYSLTLNILYDLSSVLGNEVLTFEEFCAALTLMFEESDIGTIPTSADEIIIGSASMLRVKNIKAAYIMGLNEGEFPTSIKDNGIFTDNEKAMLEELSIELSSDTNTKMSEELFFLYRALSIPSQGLILSHSLQSSDGVTQRQSIAIDRVQKLFPLLEPISDSKLSPVDKIWNIETAKEAYPYIKDRFGANNIADLISSKDEDDRFINTLTIPLSQKNCSVSSEVVKELFGNRISLTQSRLEK